MKFARYLLTLLAGLAASNATGIEIANDAGQTRNGSEEKANESKLSVWCGHPIER